LTRLVRELFAEVAEAGDPEAGLARRVREHAPIPGFGHPLYPDGDTRAATLLDMVREVMPGSPELAFADRIAAATEDLIGRKPNIDFATVTLERALGLPDDSALALFLLGRAVGWVAHALEQAATGALIRPRARYTGPRAV
jgi:citrate synthase